MKTYMLLAQRVRGRRATSPSVASSEQLCMGKPSSAGVSSHTHQTVTYDLMFVTLRQWSLSHGRIACHQCRRIRQKNLDPHPLGKHP